METLKYWLEQIERNQDNQDNQDSDRLTHWEIQVLMTELINFVDSTLLKQIHPLLIAIRDGNKSHKHKSLIAKFTLKLIKKYEDLEKNNTF